jgi:DNA gyrase/topoisomerase IV subunit B
VEWVRRRPALEVLLTEVHSGGKMSGNSNYSKSGGTNGIGASMVNALSSVFQATVNRDGKQYQLTWKDAVKQGEMSVKPHKYEHTGTTIKFAPNLKYFASAETGIIPVDFMVNLLEERSFLNYGVKTNLTYGDFKKTFYHEKLSEFV